MALLGFTTVYIADGLSAAFARGKLGDYSGAELWDKLVDRLLDRDVPRTVSEPIARPKPKPKPAPAPKTVPTEAPGERVARADLEAESPEAYARESRGLHDARAAREAQDSRARIDAILKKVGVPPR